MNDLSTFKICGVTMICLVSLLAVRNLRESFSPILRVTATLLFAGLSVTMLFPLVSFCREMTKESGTEEYIGTIFKALGVAFLTHLTARICRDCGEESLSLGVETAGKTELLILALPLIREVLETAREMLSW